jgi:FAD/FMN-containing dehydrogenase
MSEALLGELRAALGAAHVLTADLDAYSVDWRKKFRGEPLAVVRPADTAEVERCTSRRSSSR